MPPSASSASAMIFRWASISTVRTEGTPATAETHEVMRWVRISAATFRPAISTVGARPATAAGSAGSMPASSTASVTARYMAPVSRYRACSAPASRLATVDLPVPDGPSSATTPRSSPLVT
jgi:hypothetical protein